MTEGELEVAPTDGIEIPSPPEKPVPILSDDEIAALLKTCAVPRGRPGVFDRAVFVGRRDEVVLWLLLDTGVRVSELCGLAVTDVDLDRELAYVTGRLAAVDRNMVPKDQLPLITAAEEYLTLRNESWTLRANALRSGKMSILWIADKKEALSLEALRRVKSGTSPAGNP